MAMNKLKKLIEPFVLRRIKGEVLTELPDKMVSVLNSQMVDEQRDIDTMLSETRMALEKAGIEGPYVLCPHSMSGLEALYWAQKYPEEAVWIWRYRRITMRCVSVFP